MAGTERSLLRTHFYFDYFIPGGYYGPTADNSCFARVEIVFLLF